MSSEYRWYLPERIIYAQLQGNITIEDLYKGSEAISRYLYESPSESIHLIFDANKMTGIGFNVVPAWGILSYLRHPRLKWIVLFGAKGILANTVKIFASVIESGIKLRFHMCDTLDETFIFLQQQDNSLPNLRSQDGQ